MRHDQHQRVPLGTSEAHDWFVSRLLRAARELRCRSNWGELSPVLSHSFCCCRLLSCQRLFIRALEFIPTACSELYACVVVAPAVDGLLLRMWGVSIAVVISAYNSHVYNQGLCVLCFLLHSLVGHPERSLVAHPERLRLNHIGDCLRSTYVSCTA